MEHLIPVPPFDATAYMSQNENTLRAVAQWVRLWQQCPHCEHCVKEISSLTGMIPPVIVKTNEEWDHLTARALVAFFDVLAGKQAS